MRRYNICYLLLFVAIACNNESFDTEGEIQETLTEIVQDKAEPINEVVTSDLLRFNNLFKKIDQFPLEVYFNEEDSINTGVEVPKELIVFPKNMDSSYYEGMRYFALSYYELADSVNLYLMRCHGEYYETQIHGFIYDLVEEQSAGQLMISEFFGDAGETFTAHSVVAKEEALKVSISYESAYEAIDEENDDQDYHKEWNETYTITKTGFKRIN